MFAVNKNDRRQGMADVAQQAGVSLSTVDRVLNERGSVSDSKRRKVLQAAQAQGVETATAFSRAWAVALRPAAGR